MATSNGSAPPAVLTQEKGSATGARIYESWDTYSGLIPTDPAPADIDLMLNRDGKARSLEQVLTLPLRWASWSVEPAEGDAGEAELVRDALFRPANAGGMSTPWELVVAQMASAALYRRAFFEKVFQVLDGRLVYRKLAWRHPGTCTLERDKKDQAFDGFTQKFHRNSVPVEERFRPDKAFVYLHAQHKDPLFGASEMDTCWRIFDAKQKVRFLWLSFLENQTIPKATATVDSGDETEARSLASKVATMKGGAVVGLVRGQSVDTFESSGQGAAEFRAAMDWLSAEQSQSVLASFTDLASQGSGRGSFALSRDQSDLYLRGRQAVLGEMAGAATSWAAADLVRWNMGPSGKAPRLVVSDLAEHQSEAALGLFESMAGTERGNPRVPVEFMDLLTEKVAHHLEIDVDRVRKAIEVRDARSPTDRLREGVDRAVALVEEAGLST